MSRHPHQGQYLENDAHEKLLLLKISCVEVGWTVEKKREKTHTKKPKKQQPNNNRGIKQKGWLSAKTTMSLGAVQNSRQWDETESDSKNHRSHRS